MFDYETLKIDKYVPIGSAIVTGRSKCRAMLLKMNKGNSVLLPDADKKTYFVNVARSMDIKVTSRRVGDFPYKYRVWKLSDGPLDKGKKS